MWQKTKNIYHLLNSVLANIFYGFPSNKLLVIGVTGTDGKTTTSAIIHHVLNSAGLNASMISSVGAVINGKNYDLEFHRTTPAAWRTQRFIKMAKDAGSKYLVLEITSHALDQNRVWGINFEVGVLTNVTSEHLDYHKTYENYLNTKCKLLEKANIAIVNHDDVSFDKVNSKFKTQKSKVKVKSKSFITYGMRKDSDINPATFLFKTNLIGDFNKYNILAAVGACRALGLEDEQIRKGIETFRAPIGREELVYKNSFSVMVDFAHTPNALNQLLSSVKPKVFGRLIHVFGSAGERDYKKRPEMGEISSKYADTIILTAEDPRSEKVEEIIEEIVSGIENRKKKIGNGNGKWTLDNGNLLKIMDRQEAINKAIEMAKKGDFVVVTGKGHEKSMNYGKGEVVWSEHEAVRKALALKSSESRKK
ncbi:MAG: UDP-N-acetylmuramoyl-L-alanyl-D-glutamate--2,6-diaminopimelate ligase [Patescibacteria group bacterium]|nr:UDP-N-acetylmuramoyl-L-alanyl-D-glutamate--2,6-diaminopimelate ligase [Patescibacteria group bacterium]